MEPKTPTQPYLSSSLNFPPSLPVRQKRRSPSATQVMGKVPVSHSLLEGRVLKVWTICLELLDLNPASCIPAHLAAHGSQDLTPKSMGQGCSISHPKREKSRTENIGSRRACPMQSTLSTLKLWNCWNPRKPPGPPVLKSDRELDEGSQGR